MKELEDVLHYYLPYKLQINISHRNQPDFEGELTLPYLADPTGVKPILIPLSKLTEEIEHEGKKFVPIEKLKNNGNNINNEADYWTTLELLQRGGYCGQLPLWIIEYLLQWHFDIFGLIQEKSAIEKQLISHKQ